MDVHVDVGGLWGLRAHFTDIYCLHVCGLHL